MRWGLDLANEVGALLRKTQTVAHESKELRWVVPTYQWPQDPSIKTTPLDGLPPEGHVRRCQGRSPRFSKQAGYDVQCVNWALKDSNRCGRHIKDKKHYYKASMAGYYSMNAGPLLKAKLEQLAAQAPQDRQSLSDEVDFVRMLALESVALFEATIESGKADLQSRAAAIARGAMESVATMVEKHARVKATSESTIDLEQVDYIIAQIVRIIEHRVAAVNKPLADKVIADISDIRMPDTQHSATDPRDIAHDVIATLKLMKGSVPTA